MIFWSATLFAVATLASQSAMDFFATLLLVGVIWRGVLRIRSGQNWREVVPRTGFDWIWIVWLGVVVLSFVFSPIEGVAWAPRLFEFKWILTLYAMIFALRELGLKPAAQKPAAILFGVCSLYAIVIWFLGFDPIKPDYDMAPWVGGRRTGGLLSNAMTFAHVYGTYFCLALGLTWLAIQKHSAYWRFVAIAVLLSGVAILLSFTRGVWIAMAVATLTMAFVYSWRTGALVSVVGAAGLWVATLLWPTLHQRLTHISSTGDEREWIWKAHWNIFTDHPWTGVGYGENFKLVPEYYKMIGAPNGTLVSHAHNQYLHWLAGTGVIGLLVYLLFLFLFLRLNFRVWRSLRNSGSAFEQGLALGCLGAQVAFVVGGLTEANFEHSKMKYVMLIIWSIVVWLSERNLKTAQK